LLAGNAGSVAGVLRRPVVGVSPEHSLWEAIGPETGLARAPGPVRDYDPGAEGCSGVVAHSDVDAVPGEAAQGGGPVVGHDGGHRGVNPGESLRSLARRAPRASSRAAALATCRARLKAPGRSRARKIPHTIV
jgi:hypothetical protein